MESPSPNAIRTAFGRDRVFLPVIHPARGLAGAMEAVGLVVRHGADGVFLINQGMDRDEVVKLAEETRSEYPKLWIGLNLLGYSPVEVLEKAPWIDGIWSDNAGYDHPASSLPYAEELAARRRELEWEGLWFGGVAFKTQRRVPRDRWGAVAAEAARHMDVVTTSGPGTGIEVDPDKPAAFRAAIGHSALGLASGVTEENVHKVLPFVNAFLVGTGIEAKRPDGRPRRGLLVEASVRILAEKIHGWNPS